MVKRVSEVAKETDRLARERPDLSWEECYEKAKELYKYDGGAWNVCK